MYIYTNTYSTENFVSPDGDGYIHHTHIHTHTYTQAGVNFLTENFVGPDGDGYLDVGSDEYSAPQHTLDVVWSDGPFYMQVKIYTRHIYVYTYIVCMDGWMNMCAYGYFDVGDDEYSAPQHTLDVVWSDGPFYM